MLRNLLRLHPRLECPEETHFYRWADPFGSPRYDKNYITTNIFENHRKLDGISNKDFHEARYNSRNRKDMSDAYGQLYLSSIGNPEGRWFDKTPQNIYGLFLLSAMYPDSKFVHIHRNPLNVVASLVEGKVMARHSVKGAVNYWMESVIIINEYKKIYANRLIELAYEDVATQPYAELSRLCDFIGEDKNLIDPVMIKTHPEQNNYKKILDAADVEYVLANTEPYFTQYLYGVNNRNQTA